MKISKLFHWLYAILMLLPFLVFLPNAFYYGFNEHAVAQEKTEQVPNFYLTNDVNDVNDLIIDRIYHYSNNFTPIDPLPSNNQYLFYIYNTINLQTQLNIPSSATSLYLFINAQDGKLYISYGYNGTYPNFDLVTKEFDFVLRNPRNNFTYTNNIINYFSASSLQIENGTYSNVTTSMSITDSMSYAWDSVWQNDLFSWSYGSFLTEPFIYIGNVFNVPNDNSLYYALSYWLDISIIWLCFDLVMYIPLLVHRWLDKGIIE